MVVAAAIAFGLGGREIAGQKLGKWIKAVKPKMVLRHIEEEAIVLTQGHKEG